MATAPDFGEANPAVPRNEASQLGTPRSAAEEYLLRPRAPSVKPHRRASIHYFMKQTLLGFLSFLCVAALAQPTPCTDENPVMTPFCEEACIICDIDGFTGRHESSIPGALPDDFCTFVVHNAQWIAFIAGSETLTVQLTVSNCDDGPGLEIAIYEAPDCTNFNLISNCWGGVTGPVQNGQTKSVTTNQPLTIGQYYYLAMDGVGGDNCDWTLQVTEGSTQAIPLTASGPVEGPATTCPEVATTYTLTPETAATEFRWTLDGQVFGPSAPSVEVDWPGPGSYELCVVASNACDEATPSCRTILVERIPDTVLDPVICAGEVFTLDADHSFDATGNYTVDYTTAEGCDSVVRINLEVNLGSSVDLSFNICEDDAITVGGTTFDAAGSYELLTENAVGCDSTISLELGVIVCNIEGTATGGSVVCAGGTDGRVSFSITSGTPPFVYQLQNLTGTFSEAGNIVGLNETTVIENLAAGTYLVNVFDNFGNQSSVLIVDVPAPPPLVVDAVAVDQNGFGLSCAGAGDGRIDAQVTGGVAPYTYLWSNGATDAALTDLDAATYALTLTDALGCVRTAAVELTEPAAISLTASFTNADCSGVNTGAIRATPVGGAPPFTYDFGDGNFVAQSAVENLPPGSYLVTARDANGCVATVSGTLTAPDIPAVELPEVVDLDLGETVRLPHPAPGGFYTFAWDTLVGGGGGLSCLDCAQPLAGPVRTTSYSVAVTSADGCVATDELLVRVVPRRRLFVPTGISPNDDGNNDRLIVSAGPEVVRLLDVRIFDRWGNQLYARDEALPGETLWDGRANGLPLDVGVYIWSFRVEYLDGLVEGKAGSVAVLR